MKRSKSPSEDQIVVETVKNGGDQIIKKLTTLLNLCFEKDGLINVDHYRPIRLLSLMAKPFCGKSYDKTA